MYKGVIAFIVMQLLALVVVAYNPRLVNYLPTRLSLTSETAPPPLNPKLQHCVEQFVFNQYSVREEEIRAAIERARKLDLSSLPKKLADGIEESFDDAQKTFELREAGHCRSRRRSMPRNRPTGRCTPRPGRFSPGSPATRRRSVSWKIIMRQVTGEDAAGRKEAIAAQIALLDTDIKRA